MKLLEMVILTASLHTGGYEGFNENNIGIGLEAIEESTGLDLTVGGYVYHNSYYATSLMASVRKDWRTKSGVMWGVGLGVANGYEHDINNVNGFLASPQLMLGYKHIDSGIGIRVITTAPFGTLVTGYDVVNLQFTFN